ncbi:MAG TPA: hypothetical protein VIG68_02770 [Lysobacter sp.]
MGMLLWKGDDRAGRARPRPAVEADMEGRALLPAPDCIAPEPTAAWIAAHPVRTGPFGRAGHGNEEVAERPGHRGGLGVGHCAVVTLLARDMAINPDSGKYQSIQARQSRCSTFNN